MDGCVWLGVSGAGMDGCVWLGVSGAMGDGAGIGGLRPLEAVVLTEMTRPLP